MKSPLALKWTLTIAFGLTTILTLCLWYFVGRLPYSWFENPADAGVYGDSFGYVNSLFSGLAFAGVIVAIILQTIELRHQRDELQESQETWKETAEAQRASHTALKEQAEALTISAYLNAMLAIRDAPSIDALTDEQYTAFQRIEAICESLEGKFAFTGGKSKSLAEHLAMRLEQAAKIFRIEWRAHRLLASDEAVIASKSELERCRREFQVVLRRIDARLEQEAQNVMVVIDELEQLPKLAGITHATTRSGELNTYWVKGEQLAGLLVHFADRLRRVPS